MNQESKVDYLAFEKASPDEAIEADLMSGALVSCSLGVNDPARLLSFLIGQAVARYLALTGERAEDLAETPLYFEEVAKPFVRRVFSITARLREETMRELRERGIPIPGDDEEGEV